MNYRVFVPLLLFITLAVFFVWSLEWRKVESSQVINRTLVGQTFPTFTLSSIAGDQTYTNTNLPRQPFLMNIWATWCPSCYVEHEFLNELDQRGITIIGLNYKDNREKALKYLIDLGNPYQFNVADKRGSLAIDLGVTGAPETYLIGADGIIYYKHEGVINNAVWEAKFLPLYNELQRQ